MHLAAARRSVVVVNVSMQNRRVEGYRNPEDWRKFSAERRKLGMRFHFVH
jgi:hypothetical protein